jgi:hypothetical protein
MLQSQAEGRVVLRPQTPFDGVKVFSATLFNDRQQLGEKITAWIADHPQHELTEIIVTQSSDEAFHCIAFTVFYRSPRSAAS